MYQTELNLSSEILLTNKYENTMITKKTINAQLGIINVYKDGLLSNFMFMSFMHLFLIIFFISCGESGQSRDPVAVNPIDWDDALEQEAEWYQSSEAVRIADNVLLYQHPSTIQSVRGIMK